MRIEGTKEEGKDRNRRKDNERGEQKATEEEKEQMRRNEET